MIVQANWVNICPVSPSSINRGTNTIQLVTDPPAIAPIMLLVPSIVA